MSGMNGFLQTTIEVFGNSCLMMTLVTVSDADITDDARGELADVGPDCSDRALSKSKAVVQRVSLDTNVKREQSLSRQALRKEARRLPGPFYYTRLYFRPKTS